MKSTKTLLPGFGRPLNYVPKMIDPDFVGKLFPNALSAGDIQEGRVAQRMITVRETTMLRMMNSVTDKPDWHLKVNNPEILQKWKEEALASGPDFSSKMADWCIDELRFKASLITDPVNPPPMVVYNGDVIKSDTAISMELKEALQKAVKKFEDNIPERQKDWHPLSDEKVWDLVHPSLFPLVYGRTKVLANGETTTLEDFIERSGQGEIAPVPPEDQIFEEGVPRSSWGLQPTPFSAKFQWLPCEVDVSSEEVKIKTYINNLHPAKEKLLYGLIEKLIGASIPLWNLTLAGLKVLSSRKHRISYSGCKYDPDPASWVDSEGPQQEPDEDDGDFWHRRQKWIEDTRRLVYPEPELPFAPIPEPPKFDLKEEYAHPGLQVIVKLANIELTPEKPEYEGGSWHVEGQLNEHIVATSLYYYSNENITTSTLSFRQQCDPDEANEMEYEQNDHSWLSPIFGCEQDGPGVQDIGGVETREGRLLTFPNILQHRVGSFKLADPTKPGHRKIVALFLVDPNIKVISTAHVPCQRQDWWWETVMSRKDQTPLVAKPLTAAHGRQGGTVDDIPIELQDNILKGVDFPFSLQEAKALRLELMEERKKFVVDYGRAFESSVFSLCEH